VGVGQDFAVQHDHWHRRVGSVSFAAPVHGRRSNLPAPVSSFVGRRQVLADLQALIGSTRLLTLTGAGGIGKTRLALELAHVVAPRFADGAWLVELAPIAEPTHVLPAVAEAFGVKERPGRSVDDAVLAALERRDLLLVLDNCEHLVGACAEVTQKLLPACAGLRILATSREPLGLDGEVRWLVPPLALAPRRERDGGSSEEVEAVRLFIERARAANSAFGLRDRDTAIVAEICRVVDGTSRLRSSSRLPGCECYPLARSSSGSKIVPTCYRAACARSSSATALCPPPCSGATTCSQTANASCSPSCLSFVVGGHSTPPRTSATVAARSPVWRGWSINRWYWRSLTELVICGTDSSNPSASSPRSFSIRAEWHTRPRSPRALLPGSCRESAGRPVGRQPARQLDAAPLT
jgi:hypothetical protein